MSIWTRIADALSALTQGEGLASFLDRLRTPPERSITFTIGVIALGAKIAKADGAVCRNEVRAFREVFRIAPEDEAHAARVFNLARTDVAGFEAYAQRIRRLFGTERAPLGDLLEGLFHIALADGDWHAGEEEFLRRVAAIFGFDGAEFDRILARLVPVAGEDPWQVLGIAPEADLATARAAWVAEVKECHPDRLIARGLPPEAIALAEKRLIAVNSAWEVLRARLGPREPA